MNERDTSPIGFFQKYLTVWVILCMAVGICIGKFLPQIPEFLNRFEYARVSIPMAILIWVMIYPMMMKVDFRSIKDVGKNPKGLFVTWIVNWLIKPFTMYGMASLFFFVVFKAFIAPELATEYLAGAVLLGAAPCTAMVFVWSALTKGDPAYTVVQVATNDLIILVAFVPIVKFLLGVSNVSVPWDTLILSVVLFVVIPLAGGMLTRYFVTRKKGAEYFESTFVKKFDGITTIGLLLTLVLIFAFQGQVILDNPLHIVLIAVPLILQTFLIFGIAYGACWLLKLPHRIARRTCHNGWCIDRSAGDAFPRKNCKQNERQVPCMTKPKVAFICVHNSCRSQIAEALGKALASDVFESYSAGTETKPQINQDAVRLIKALYGIDMEQTQYSKLISDIPEPDIAISMGCNVGCPFIGRPFDDNWELEDPTGKSDEEFKKVIDEIRVRIMELKQRLGKNIEA